MPVFIGDYLADTMHLSTEQHGAYLLLLFHLWRRGSLRDEDAVLAQISGLSESAWKQHRPVLAEFFRIDGGLWQHARVEKERARVAATTESKAKKAKLAASSRWGKKDASSIAQAMPGDADSDSESDSESDLKTFPRRREEQPQVPPLRFAPVGMTNWRVAAHLGMGGEGWTEANQPESNSDKYVSAGNPLFMTSRSLPKL